MNLEETIIKVLEINQNGEKGIQKKAAQRKAYYNAHNLNWEVRTFNNKEIYHNSEVGNPKYKEHIQEIKECVNILLDKGILELHPIHNSIFCLSAK